jgi:hypothetical protein
MKQFIVIKQRGDVKVVLVADGAALPAPGRER